MSTRRTIVTYNRIEAALRRTRAAAAGHEEEALESAGTAVLPRPPAAEDYVELAGALQLLEQAEHHPQVMSGTEDRVSSLLQTYLAKEALRANKVDRLAQDEDGLEAKFDNFDLAGWIGSFFTWWKRIRKHKWLRADADAPAALPPDARVAIFGDWGTGRYGAPAIARSIAENPKRYSLVMHLGDVYYSGDDNEIKERLLDVWPRVAGADSRALNGNHEMFTGGHAYFRDVFRDFGQKASYFAYQNDDWILAGLDTAYADHDLHGEQAAWVQGLSDRAGDRRLILFSHHQPFSLLDKQGPRLVAKLGRLLETGKIFAWYWGHEHHCILYDAHPAWGMRGRCVGHGGFPYFRDDHVRSAPSVPVPGAASSSPLKWKRLDARNLVPGGIILDGANPLVEPDKDNYGPHGYIALEFDGRRLNEIVHDADGTRLFERQLAEN
jgi:hypothetical protein